MRYVFRHLPIDGSEDATRASELAEAVVLADRVEGKNPFPSVAVDNKQAGYIGGKHLFDCGYREIAFVNHGRRFWILNQRREGFVERARAAGDEMFQEVGEAAAEVVAFVIRGEAVPVLGSRDAPAVLRHDRAVGKQHHGADAA
jgi:hypothetical protein